jgi:ferric-dicitrate binding protein FerR (iron transport regulator)
MNEMTNEFETRTRELLEDSVQRVDGRIRSRLNQARHAAVEEATRRRPSLWRRSTFMPAAGAVAAALLVAFFLWPHSHSGDSLTAVNSGRAGMEDLDLLADSDALDLVSDETDTGQFYEWAVDQADSNEASSTGA